MKPKYQFDIYLLCGLEEWQEFWEFCHSEDMGTDFHLDVSIYGPLVLDLSYTPENIVICKNKLRTLVHFCRSFSELYKYAIPTHLVTHGKVAWKISWIDSLFFCPGNIVESTQFTLLFAFGSMDQLMRFQLPRCMCSETTFITNELFVLLTCYKMIWKKRKLF